MAKAITDLTLGPRESVDSELVRKLLDALLSGSLQPGDRLPSERVLAQSLGVGRQAVRNAIKSLALLGIVETRVGSGTYFVGRESALLPNVVEWGVLLNQTWVEDLIDARVQLELTFARLACERGSDDEIAGLGQLLDAMYDKRDDFHAYAEADARFHLAIADMSKNVVLAGVLRNIASLLKAWSERVISTARETETSLPRHEEIYRAIGNRDVDRAVDAMRRHMDRAVARLRASVAEARD